MQRSRQVLSGKRHSQFKIAVQATATVTSLIVVAKDKRDKGQLAAGMRMRTGRKLAHGGG